jgi:hypothetical protein
VLIISLLVSACVTSRCLVCDPPSDDEDGFSGLVAASVRYGENNPGYRPQVLGRWMSWQLELFYNDRAYVLIADVSVGY